jgi:hypothetical protein
MTNVTFSYLYWLYHRYSIFGMHNETCVAPSVDRPVRAKNRIHSSGQRSCSPDVRPVMIIDHVTSIGVPSDHATSCMAALSGVRNVEDHRDHDPAPPVRRPATAAAAMSEH